MEKKAREENKITYPDVLLKIHGGCYAVNSRYIISIMQLPSYNEIPEAPAGVLGILPFRNATLPLLDMRTVFGLSTLSDEYHRFTQMLEDRKQDHITWVKVLEDSIKTGSKFRLATDPHKCAFGRWYDSFQSDNSAVNFHMKKIEEPHRKLHEAAIKVESCKQDHEHCTRDTCLKEVFKEVEDKYMPVILQILDEAKEVFKSAYSEMVVALGDNERQIGIVVDEVLSVEELEVFDSNTDMGGLNRSPYISGVRTSKNVKGLILQLNDEKLIEFSKTIPEK